MGSLTNMALVLGWVCVAGASIFIVIFCIAGAVITVEKLYDFLKGG